VSNFFPDRVMDFLVHHDIAPVVDQIETHPFHQQIDTQAFLHDNGVQIESWGPFAEGKHNIFNNEVLRTIAEEHDRTVAQVIVRWLTQRGVVAIPKSVRRDRIEENFQVFDFDLTPANMQAVASLDSGTSSFFDHRDPAMVKMLGEAQRAT
jgi:2,5-diketo-D-gluconate reductase A